MREILRKEMRKVAKANFYGRYARSVVVPLDLVKELRGRGEDSAEE